MRKRDFTERDVCSKLITPALRSAGWDLLAQVSEEKTLTDGRITVRGRVTTRGVRKRADYVLYVKPNIPIAIIEAKDNRHAIGDGMQQALTYAQMLRVPFAFSSNGDGFLFHDATGQSPLVETTLGLDNFPSPAELLLKYEAWKGLSPEASKIAFHDYRDMGKTPRYYQINAVNSAVEAIAKGQQRLLLVMATGTGKTFTAFQIIWRLWKSGAKKRILFLADRNVLVDQTMVNDFRPFTGAMAKLSTHAKIIERADGTREATNAQGTGEQRQEARYLEPARR
ncbi:DEAD/DEAH box helicase family protein [Thioclava sp. GXIMD4215]